MYRMSWKVYGSEGHRQRESFFSSVIYDFSSPFDGKRIIEVNNFDKTGTHEYSVITITKDTKEDCENEFIGQIEDGIFEDSTTGRKELIYEEEI